jgi:hypothetical protein
MNSLVSINVADVRETDPQRELDKTSDKKLKKMLELSAAITPKIPKITKESVAVMRPFEAGKCDALLITQTVFLEAKNYVSFFRKLSPLMISTRSKA